jgi:hypothetical protein
MFLSINLVFANTLQAIFYCIQMCCNVFCDSMLMLKLFWGFFGFLFQLIMFGVLMGINVGLSPMFKEFKCLALCVIWMLVRMYLTSFPSVSTKALAFIVECINKNSQASYVYCWEMCRQVGALCEAPFDISDVRGEKTLRWPLLWLPWIYIWHLLLCSFDASSNHSKPHKRIYGNLCCGCHKCSCNVYGGFWNIHLLHLIWKCFGLW